VERKDLTMSKQIFEDSIESASVEYMTAITLLLNAENIFSNVIGHCKDELCEVVHLCRQCTECEKMCKEIDGYINGN